MFLQARGPSCRATNSAKARMVK